VRFLVDFVQPIRVSGEDLDQGMLAT
jgi:hypothetical protein